MSIGYTPTSVLKNCFRCGREFSVVGDKRLCSDCRKPRQNSRPVSDKPLSFREKQIMNLIRQAKTNKEIGLGLHLTEGTIKEYINQLFKKIGVRNRTELAIWALAAQRFCDNVTGNENFPGLPELFNIGN